jgi:hypothetical protein
MIGATTDLFPAKSFSLGLTWIARWCLATANRCDMEKAA